MNARAFASFAAAALGLLWVSSASATTCPSAPSCTLDGQTFDVGAFLGGSDPAVNPDASQDIFLATFTTPNQSNSAIATLVEDFLAAEGIANDVNYLGRQDGSGALPGTSISTGSGSSGTWTFDPGLTGEIGAFFAIHAGEGQTDSLFGVVDPGLSGVWSTAENGGHGLSNFDLFDGGSNGTEGGCGGDLPPCPSVPEPITLSLFGAGLAGAVAVRRRRKQSA